ncbi:MAG: hypothetical protein U5K30_15930 [Acidimicrobiales bacterium]|nr:hypothetical protein [Acidimicrobiales bacterium]
MRGKWAQGITPRHFTWILQDRLAVCERPGGYGANHRKVRRQEEIIWLREQGFTAVISLVESSHNLHNYDELGVPWRHRPFTASDDQEAFLKRFFPELRQLLVGGGKIVIHQDELGDRMCGLMAAYVLWSELVPGPPQAISIIEQLLHRQLGSPARHLVALVGRMPGPDELEAPVPSPAEDAGEHGAGEDGAGDDDQPADDAAG